MKRPVKTAGLKSVLVVCKGCDGTGLTTSDLFILRTRDNSMPRLPADTMRACLFCDGTGSFEQFYEPFVKRTPLGRIGVRYVQLYDADACAKADKITVTEFYARTPKKRLSTN